MNVEIPHEWAEEIVAITGGGSVDIAPTDGGGAVISVRWTKDGNIFGLVRHLPPVAAGLEKITETIRNHVANEATATDLYEARRLIEKRLKDINSEMK